MNSVRLQRLVAVLSLCAFLGAFAGCGGKKEEEAKPANGEFYTGPMKEKPKADTKKKMGDGGER